MSTHSSGIVLGKKQASGLHEVALLSLLILLTLCTTPPHMLCLKCSCPTSTNEVDAYGNCNSGLPVNLQTQAHHCTCCGAVAVPGWVVSALRMPQICVILVM